MSKPVQNLTTDNFWGCTIRSMQMLIANGILESGLVVGERHKDKKILELFHNNKRGSKAQYSIQNVVELGLKDYGIYPGEWYGINTVSTIFEELTTYFNPIPLFKLLTFQNGAICLDLVK